MAATKQTMKSSPIVNVISSAVSCVKPRFTKRGWSFDTTPLGPVKSWPCERPSKLVVPIIVHSSATVPGTGASRGGPASGGRGVEPRRAGERRARVQDAVAPVQGRESREEAEVHRQRVGAAGPGRDAE